MVRDGRSAPAGAQARPAKRVEWVVDRMVILWSMDPSLAMQDISVYAFRHKLERFLQPLLRARGSEEMVV